MNCCVGEFSFDLVAAQMFFVKQKTADEMRISDWSSDVCSSDLGAELSLRRRDRQGVQRCGGCCGCDAGGARRARQCAETRSEEHTSELQSLMRISYAVFCLKKQTTGPKRAKWKLHRISRSCIDKLTHK